MIARIAVTLSALLLIGASSNPHTIEVRAVHQLRMDSAHVFLGIAVLGHHVSRIDGGWLVKQADPGFMTIDWNVYGKWDGLTRTEEGPRDVSTAQLDAVVRTIEGLGIPAATIRAWRVPAPVGMDGFHEGDKVLTIGEILIDLGTADQAGGALDRWNSATFLKDPDPLDAIPLTNVRDTNALYLRPDCAAEGKTERDDALAQTGAVASSIASYARTRAEFANYDAPIPDDVLCPEDREPYFARPTGLSSISWNGRSSNLTSQQVAPIVTYTLAGLPDEAFVPPVRDGLATSTASYGFDLNEPYAATIATASTMVRPDAVVLHFSYDLGWKARKGYDEDLRTAMERVAALQSLVADPGDILVQRPPAQSHQDSIDVLVLLKRGDPRLGTRLETAGRRPGNSRDGAAYVPFLASCDAARETAVTLALGESRRKADVLAGIVHAKIRGLSAARVGIYGDPVCGFDPHASLATLAASVTPSVERPFDGDLAKIAVWRTVNAAWSLDRVARTAVPLVRIVYRAEARGARVDDSLRTAALEQAARQAVVDDPHIVSMFESDVSDFRLAGGLQSASETLVVLR